MHGRAKGIDVDHVDPPMIGSQGGQCNGGVAARALDVHLGALECASVVLDIFFQAAERQGALVVRDHQTNAWYF
jgi:hypothetical protein